MKKLFTLSLILFLGAGFINIHAQTQIPNGGFENWSDTVTCDSWKGKVSYGFGLVNHYFLTRTTDKHSGNFAAKIQSKSDALFGALPGIATLGSLSFDVLMGFDIKGGAPISGKPIKLNGYYKYNNVQGDTMAVILLMYQWNASLNKRDTVFVGQFMNKNTVNTYSPFSINISYLPSTATPDTFNIILVSSSGYVPQVGTALFVDELSFEYNNAGISEMAVKEMIDVFPNPASEYVTVKVHASGVSQVRLVSITGQEVYFNENVFSKDVIDVSLLPEGIYFVEVKADKKYTTKKIVVTR